MVLLFRVYVFTHLRHDNDGNVPIHLAAFNGSSTCLRLLLATIPTKLIHNDDTDRQDNDTATNGSQRKDKSDNGVENSGVSDCAVSVQQQERERSNNSNDNECGICAVDVNVVNATSGGTALHYAAANGHSQCVKLLLESDEIQCNVANTADGNMPLHLAAMFNRYVQIIMEKASNRKMRHYL